ncbi:MAG: LLM class flavin-dependent oxidoreductase [Actinomycetota bacterium]|nr:LLM class flavin-dependent oxidoreductase [Actinomycetota bacterium]
MRVGVGLPNTIPGVPGEQIAEWSRRADAGPFSSVAVLDRLAYESIDPFAALATAAAVTTHVRLATMVAVGPLRSTGMLVKEAISIDELSGGRLTLGLAVGARHDDYEAAGIDPKTRGRRLDEQLVYLRGSGNGHRGLRLREDVELLVGGTSGQAFARVARYADGYAHGGGPPRAFQSAAARARAAWSDLGRSGSPRLWGQGYFALGDEERGNAYLRDYYAFTGPFAEKIVAGNLTSARAIRDFIRGYEEAGCDELVLLPTVAEISQLERLIEVIA